MTKKRAERCLDQLVVGLRTDWAQKKVMRERTRNPRLMFQEACDLILADELIEEQCRKLKTQVSRPPLHISHMGGLGSSSNTYVHADQSELNLLGHDATTSHNHQVHRIQNTQLNCTSNVTANSGFPPRRLIILDTPELSIFVGGPFRP